MFKCNLFFLLVIISFNVSCAMKKKIEGPIADMTKVCREGQKLVFQIIPFERGDFTVSDEKILTGPNERTYDLKKSVAQSYGLEWLQLKFKNQLLYSLWYGPRGSFEKDMDRVGINTYYIRDQRGKKLNSFNREMMYTKDLSGRVITIEHQGSAVNGVMVTCTKL